MPKVFQYGSNMNKERFYRRMSRAGDTRIITDHGRYDLRDHKVVFDVYSDTNQCAAGDLNFEHGSKIIGRIWEITGDQLARLDVVEGVPTGKNKRKTLITPYGDVITYVATDGAKEDFILEHKGTLPSNRYLEHILAGLNDREIRAEIEYISNLVGEGRPRLSDRRAQVDQTYDNLRKYRISSTGINGGLRRDLGIDTGDFVQVSAGDEILNMQVRKAPKELVASDSPSYASNPVTISREARDFLEIPIIGTREDAEKFKNVYGGVLIAGLKK